MRILVFTTSFWHDAEHARRKEGTIFGHRRWLERVTRAFKPVGVFVAAGSWSDPSHSPIPEVATVNSGVPFSKPYDGYRFSYAKMAFTSALAYALNRASDWDLLIQFDTEALIGAIDIPKLLGEFMSRPELLLANALTGYVTGGIMVWKREGAIRFLHRYPYPSFVDDDEPGCQMPIEHEFTAICRGRHWWNPWPNNNCMIQAKAGVNNSDDEAIHWPTLYMPTSDAFAERYEQNHIEKCVTM